MTYLQRINYLPKSDDLSEREQDYLRAHFDAYGAEAVINGDPVEWRRVEEVEVATAARSRGPSGWLVKNLVMGGDRYHVALYAGREEFVLSNVTLKIAAFVVQTAAYYAPGPVIYTGPEGLSPLTEI
jgi:hypothetical protein